MNLDCLSNSFDLEMLVGAWFQHAMEVCLIIGDGEACAESQMMEETDSLGISALNLEGTIRGALR